MGLILDFVTQMLWPDPKDNVLVDVPVCQDGQAALQRNRQRASFGIFYIFFTAVNVGRPRSST
jgi:hypothetical protein